MNVASLELCKELYELGGWGDVRDVWKYTEPMSTDIKYGTRKDGDRWCYSIQKGPMRSWNLNEVSVWPAYDLGYLLRKLPEYVKLFRNNMGVYYCAAVTDSYRHPDNRLGEPDSAHKWYMADTPEDAAAKLTVELFKQGVLTKSEQENH
jgi:hypothetical protein